MFSLFTFHMLLLLPVSPPKTPYLIPSPPAHQPTHSWFPVLAFPYTGALSLQQDQGPFLPLMSDKAILCYICGWSLGFLHVYSLVGGLVPGRSRTAGWFVLLFLLLGCKNFYCNMLILLLVRKEPTMEHNFAKWTKIHASFFKVNCYRNFVIIKRWVI